MATIVVQSSPVQQSFPAGTQQGKWRIDIGAGTEQLTDDPMATFEAGPGDYTATVQALDANGSPLGDAKTATFSIAAAPVMLAVSGDVSVTIQ